MKTCGFCAKFCYNEHCIVYEENMSEIEALIEKMKWTTIYTKEDLIEAFKLGQNTKLKELKEKVVGMDVNGTCQGILNEKDLV